MAFSSNPSRVNTTVMDSKTRLIVGFNYFNKFTSMCQSCKNYLTDSAEVLHQCGIHQGTSEFLHLT